MTDAHTAAARREAAIELLRQDPDTRVLQRVVEPEPRPVSSNAIGRVRTIAVIDTETTGFDVRTDEIIDLAVGMIHVDETGAIVGIGPAASSSAIPADRSRRTSAA